MKFVDIVRLATDSLIHRGLRSWLAILGIVIGVAAVTAILSVGEGAQQAISAQLGSLGADIITVSPGFERAFGIGGPGFGGGERAVRTNAGGTTATQNLTTRDVQVIKSVPGVKVVNGIASERVQVTYLTESTSLSIQGVDPLAWRDITTSELDSGRYLTPGDGNAIVIGNGVANTVFKQPLSLNRKISIGGKVFGIVGILAASGGGGFGGSDNTIFMPVSAARTIMTNLESDQFSSIQVKVTDPQLVEGIANDIDAKLMLSRHVTNRTKDYSVTSVQATRQAISNVMGTLDLFLTGIAAVSLLVGAIGIANTMFMSIVERTRLIGILKALGTTNFEVMKLFLTESAIMGFVGGVIGILLGLIASGIISDVGVRMAGIGTRGATLTVVSPQLVVFAIIFSTVIGMVSGMWPARRASLLQPVEALRYE